MEYFTDTVIELILKFWSNHKTDGTVPSLTTTLNLTIWDRSTWIHNSTWRHSRTRTPVFIWEKQPLVNLTFCRVIFTSNDMEIDHRFISTVFLRGQLEHHFCWQCCCGFGHADVVFSVYKVADAAIKSTRVYGWKHSYLVKDRLCKICLSKNIHTLL